MTLLTPDVALADPVVPVPASPTVRVRVWFGVIVVALLLTAVWGLLNPSLSSRAVILSAVLSLLVALLAGAPHLGAVRRGQVRVDRDRGRLAFVPRRGRWTIVVLPMALATVPGAIVIAAWSRGAPLYGLGPVLPIILVILSCLALFALVQGLVALRVPAGLTLRPGGLSGVRQAGRRDYRWDDLLSARAVMLRRSAGLELVPRSGRPVTVSGALLGSDPNVVAAVVRHFRDHPQDRAALTRGAGALDLVR